MLDVKVGDGAFMRTLEDARELAEAMLELGRRAGGETVCVLTDMDQPLGRAVGNALEVREAHRDARGEGPPDFTELVLAACAHLLALSDLGVDEARGGARAEAGRRRRLGADGLRAVDRGPGRRPRRGGASLGAGRRARRRAAGGVRQTRSARSRSAWPRWTSAPGGREGRRDRPRGRGRLLAKRGDAVEAGEPIAEVHARDEASATSRRGAQCAPRTSSAPSRHAAASPASSCDVRSASLARARAARGRDGSRAARARARRPARSSGSRSSTPPDAAVRARRGGAELEGERVAAVDRRGKYLIVRFESGRALLVHLRMTGSFLHAPAGRSRTIRTAVLLSV